MSRLPNASLQIYSATYSKFLLPCLTFAAAFKGQRNKPMARVQAWGVMAMRDGGSSEDADPPHRSYMDNMAAKYPMIQQSHTDYTLVYMFNKLGFS